MKRRVPVGSHKDETSKVLISCKPSYRCTLQTIVKRETPHARLLWVRAWKEGDDGVGLREREPWPNA